jgi:hypothetical protein
MNKLACRSRNRICFGFAYIVNLLVTLPTPQKFPIETAFGMTLA